MKSWDRRETAAGAALAILLACAACLAASTSAVAGPTDRSFGANGRVDLPKEVWHSEYADLAAGPNGELFVSYAKEPTCNPLFCKRPVVVRRYRADGSLSTRFGIGGETLATGVDVRYGQFGPTTSLDVGSDGRAAIAVADGEELHVARLGRGGGIDPEFNGGDKVTLRLGVAEWPEVEVDPDGRILVAIYNAHKTITVLRLDQEGRLDPTFGEGGMRETNLPFGLRALSAVRGGGFVVAAAGPATVHIRRFGPQGLPRWSRAIPTERPMPGLGSIAGLAAAPAGAVQIAAVSSRGRLQLAKVRPDGQFGRNYGRDGIFHTRLEVEWPVQMLPSRRGAATVVAATSSGTSILFRRRPNGRPDRAFFGGRPVAVRLRLETTVRASVLQPSGRTVILAESGECFRSCTPRHVALLAYRGKRFR